MHFQRGNHCWNKNNNRNSKTEVNLKFYDILTFSETTMDSSTDMFPIKQKRQVFKILTFLSSKTFSII